MPNKRHTSFNNYHVSFQVEGKGNVIVLLHGFLENMEIWYELSKILSKNFKVILIDLPGHGDTENMAENNSMELMADVVNHVLDYLSIDKCVIIGHSMGGYVSLSFAEKYTDKLSGLGLFHSHAAADTTKAKIDRGRAIQIVKENHKDFISSFIPELFTLKNRILFINEILKIQENSKKVSKEAVIASLEGMRHRTDKQKLLNTLRIPVMFIIGKQDTRTPLDKMMQQISIPKHAEILLLDDVAHMGFIESFDICSEFVNHFTKTCYTN